MTGNNSFRATVESRPETLETAAPDLEFNEAHSNGTHDPNDTSARDAPEGAKTNTELIADAASKLKITDDNVIIAVMGLTGVGKSTFIKYLSDSPIDIGHDLNSCTINVAVHPFFLNDGRQAFLVDTPGFDDSIRPEAEILEEVSNFFAATYKMKIVLAGVIYLHRISDNKMSGAMFKNLEMLKKLCGKNCYPKIVLATTMWDTMNDMQRAIKNESQLEATHDWWGELAEEGATIMRQDDGVHSAMRIVEHIMSFAEPAVMANQIERVDNNLALGECESGKVIAKELIKQREEHERIMQQKRREFNGLMKEEKARAAVKQARSEAKHKKYMEDSERAEEILRRTLGESNKELQRQIDERNAAMKQATAASAEATAASEAAQKELAALRAQQAEADKQRETSRLKDKEDFDKKWEAQRQIYAQREADILDRINRNTQAQQVDRRPSKGIGAAIGGILTALVGGATLNPVLIGIGVSAAAGGTGRTVYKAMR